MSNFDKDKDGQFKLKTESFSAKTVLVKDGETFVQKSLYKRIHGKKYESVMTNVVTNLDFDVPYPLAKIEAIEIINGKLGDCLTFEILYNGQLVNTFGFDLFVDASGYYEQRSQYDADVTNEISFRVKYNNKNDTRDIFINFILNEVK